MFQRNLSSPVSGLKNSRSKKPIVRKWLVEIFTSYIPEGNYERAWPFSITGLRKNV
jgi:hypothetical protein